MVLGVIERGSTETEKRDYKRLGNLTPQRAFLRQLSVVEQKFTKEHKPFDGPCARLDFKDELESIERESERLHGYVREEDISKLIFEDLEKYGDMKRFKEVDDSEDMEMQNINGVRVAVKIGHTITYVCDRGHKISVFIPANEYTQREAEKKVGITRAEVETSGEHKQSNTA